LSSLRARPLAQPQSHRFPTYTPSIVAFLLNPAQQRCTSDVYIARVHTPHQVCEPSVYSQLETNAPHNICRMGVIRMHVADFTAASYALPSLASLQIGSTGFEHSPRTFTTVPMCGPSGAQIELPQSTEYTNSRFRQLTIVPATASDLTKPNVRQKPNRILEHILGRGHQDMPPQI
jgi:hypothetical protein